MGVDELKVTVFGSDSSSGPWEEVWVPLYETENPGGWVQTPEVKETFTRGYSFYKIEFKARYSDRLGIKFTGV